MIDSLSATPSTVLPGGTVTIAVAAHDPDCTTPPCTSGCGQYVRADLTYWSASGGTFTTENDGVSRSPYEASADWQAPSAEGAYSISVTLADSGSFFCGGRQFATGSLVVNVATVVNEPPEITSLTADPSVLAPGGTSQLSCSATDPDGDPVTYSWSSDGGTVLPGAEGEASFTAAAPGVYGVTCLATDALGAAASSTLQIAVSAVRAERSLAAGLSTPQRVTIDEAGIAWIVDRRAGGLVGVSLADGSVVARLRQPNLSAVAATWNGQLLVGGRSGVRVLDTDGTPVRTLTPGSSLGEVVDVAVDSAARRYLALYGDTGRVVVWDETGSELLAFGSSGGGSDDLKTPGGLAVAPNGNVVVADSGNGRLAIFSPAGAFLLEAGEPGGGAGEFIQLADVEVAPNGILYATDSFQSWVQAFYPDGTLREVFGGYGIGPGELKTPVGLAISASYGQLAVASLNGSRVELFRLEDGGTTPTPGAAATPSALGFAPQAVGEPGAAQSVSLSNVGTAPLLVVSTTIEGDFSQTNDCPTSLPPGAGCSFAVRSVPSAAGPTSGALRVATNAPGGETVVGLSGSGVELPTATLAPTRVDFGVARVGTESDPATLLYTNTSALPLSLVDLTIDGEFAAATDCTELLAPGASCAIEVRFAPQAALGVRLGRLEVVSNAAGSPHVAELSGTASGEVPQILLDVAELEEGDGEERVASFPVRLSNASPDPVTVDYRTADNSAEAERDYLPVEGTLRFEPGQTERTIEVPVVGDLVLEDDEETFFVELSNPVGATLPSSRTTGTLLDDEVCPSRTLVLDGGAERLPVYGSVDNWERVDGDWQRRFDAPAPEAEFGGRAYYWAGRTATAEMRQTVDVRAFRDRILDGRQWFGFFALVRTAGADLATVRVEYLGAYGDLLDAFDSGDLSSPAAWSEVVDTRMAPPDTEWVRLRLLGWRVDADESLDAYFDEIGFGSLRTATLSIPDPPLYEGDVGSRIWDVPLELNCPVDREVRGLVRTYGGSAVDGEDYYDTVEFFDIAAETTASSVPLEVIGDTVEEPHETVHTGIELERGTDVVVLGSTTLRLVNDDSCPRTAGDWSREAGFPVERLALGGVDYLASGLRALLAGNDSDASAKLARELVATKLNLEIGTPPTVLSDAADADAFLAAHPVGSGLSGGLAKRARQLERRLATYNGQNCR